MSPVDRHQLWSAFLTAWPPERVREMTLEEYSNPDKDDAFTFWIESRLEELGSIWGGSSFKFGVYQQVNVKTKETSGGRCWGVKYAWLAKYGSTPEAAFATVRDRLIEVLDAVQAGNLARVEAVDLSPVVKWKVAFLYQGQQAPVLFPIFKKESLFHLYRAIDPGAKLGSTPYHVMYATLGDRHRALGDVFTIAEVLWKQYQAERSEEPGAWLIPLDAAVGATAEALCSKSQIDPEDVEPTLEKLLAAVDLAEGDQLALLLEGQIRALGTLTSVGPGQYGWTQVPVHFPAGIAGSTAALLRELTPTEREEFWSHLPHEEPTPAAAGPRYWKIAPGQNAAAWAEWQKRGIAAIGWSKLGDLTQVTTLEQFKSHAAACATEHGYKSGVNQVWRFRQIRPGDRIVANQGLSTIIGIGTVLEGYKYRPGEPMVEKHEFAHQISVHWDDTARRELEMPRPQWLRTLEELPKPLFEKLLAAVPGAKAAASTTIPPPPTGLSAPCAPKNVILYGPPGTGKTYSTVRRALELILGAERLAGQSEKGLMTLFREHQARGQIELITFHQSYGYEEFVEGIRPVLDRAADAAVRYELHDGAFKRIALRATAEGLNADATLPEFDELWEQLVRELERDDGRVVHAQSGKTYRLELSLKGNIVLRLCEVGDDGEVTSVAADVTQTASKENTRLYWEHRAELGPEPSKFTYDKSVQLFAREKGGSGGNHYTALRLAYEQLYDMSRSPTVGKLNPADRVARVQQVLDKQRTASTSLSFSARLPQYVLIIDEINRGNMSKILGELITLLEPDKRLTEKYELKLPLAYSPQHRFGVPPNLHVLGTMNTADRSIALMDVALRRRFTFEELMPDGEVVRSVLREKGCAEVHIKLAADIFETLNHRIRFLYDRDHQLGHAYFLEATSPGALLQVLVDRVIPMLQEYFYGAWDKICIVLGCPYSDRGEPKRKQKHLLRDGKQYAFPLVRASVFSETMTIGFDHEDYEDRVDYQVVSRLAQSALSVDDLTGTLLGVLNLDAEAFEQRRAELSGPGPMAGPPPPPDTAA